MWCAVYANDNVLRFRREKNRENREVQNVVWIFFDRICWRAFEKSRVCHSLKLINYSRIRRIFWGISHSVRLRYMYSLRSSAKHICGMLITYVISSFIACFVQGCAWCAVCLKMLIALNGTPMTELRDVVYHMGWHSVTGCPTQFNAPQPSPCPVRMEGWVDLGYPAI